MIVMLKKGTFETGALPRAPRAHPLPRCPRRLFRPLGLFLGSSLGLFLGFSLGLFLGFSLGLSLGFSLGLFLGFRV